MARSIRMPSPEELPAGPQRRFMETLFRLWVDAGMPTMEGVSEAVTSAPPQEGSASKETVRKMLTGKTVPHSWQNAEAVFLGLSMMADLNPERLVRYTETPDDDYYSELIPDPTPARAVFRQLWADARGVTTYQHGTMQDYTPSPEQSPDPWDKHFRAGSGFTPEPPF